jgi:hypothetical protein
MHEVNASAVVCAGPLALGLLLPRPAAEAWPSDPAVNVRLCGAVLAQELPAVTSDGAGGDAQAGRRGRPRITALEPGQPAADGHSDWTNVEEQVRKNPRQPCAGASSGGDVGSRARARRAHAAGMIGS